MYCTNCGHQVAAEAFACTSCGLPPRKKNKHCQHCGITVNEEQVVCIACGVKLAGGQQGIVGQAQNIYNQPKSRVSAGVLAILLGGLGAHKFYLGSWGWGLMYLVFVWTYIPAILGVIEGILILASSDEQFQTKYPVSGQSPFRF